VQITSLTIHRLICYWLIWLSVALLSLCSFFIPTVSSPEEAVLYRPASPMPTPEDLLAPIVGRGDLEWPLFPWRLKRSRRRRTIRLPQWLVRLLQLWAMFRWVRGWSMAQWVARKYKPSFLRAS